LAVIGRIVDERYEVLEEVGRGGMGVVFRARDVASSEMVAIKVLPRDISADPLQAGRFARECAALQRLSHPNVVAFHHAGELEGQPFLVMEFVQGVSAQDAVARAAEPIREALRLAVQMASALEHAHEIGIVHRDLKPGNVLVADTGMVKVMDFGLARRVHDETRNLTQTGGLVGTFAYLPPEQALGHRVDHRADMYALGVLLYELCAGVLPFTAPDPVSIIFHHISTPPTPPSSHNPAIWPDLDAFILRLMAKDPAERFGQMHEVREKLEILAATTAGEAGGAAVASRVFPFLGAERAAVRDRLVLALQECVEGRGSAWLLLGPQESGTSRLAQDLRSYAHLARARYVEAAASDPPIPARIVGQAVESLLEDLPAHERKAILETHRAVIAVVAPRLLDDPAEPPPWPDLDSFADAGCRLLLSFADKFPFLLVVDEAHRCDTASAAVVARLVDLAGRTAAMCVLAADEDRFSLKDGLDVPDPQRIVLQPLTRDEASALV